MDGLTGQPVHSGSWFGLPDFGITEALQGKLSTSPSSTGLTTNTGASAPAIQTTTAPAYNYNPNQAGLVLGTTTSAPQSQPTSPPPNTGGSITEQQALQKGFDWNNLPGGYTRNIPGQASDPYAGVKNDISNAWDKYLSDLQGTSGYLNDQQTAQQGIADSQYNQGVDTANTQKALSLRDIANTTRNAFQAGNNYLGSLGAGDSSAANQYSFAINQQAGKQTGDLNNFVNGQLTNLKSQHDQQINGIAQWFAQQQEALKQQIAQGGLQKGQDLANLSKGILDQAMQATNALKANTQNQYNALLQWAANNSTNLGQLQSNIASIPQAMGQMSLGTGSVGSTPLYGGGAPLSNQKTNIFGDRIQ